MDKKQDFCSWWCHRAWIKFSLCITGVVSVAILCYSLADYTITSSDWLWAAVELVTMLVCVVALPEQFVKNRNTRFIFPSAGYYERFIK